MWFANITAFLVLLTLLFIPLRICAKINSNRSKFGDNYVSAVAGVLAGFVFYTIYVLWQANNDILSQFIDSIIANGFYSFAVNVLSFAGGFILGMSFLSLIYKFISSRYIGMLNLSLTLISAVALHNFLFLGNSRIFVNYFALSFGGGILIHIILNTKQLKELFSL